MSVVAKLEQTGTPGIFRRHRHDCPRRGRCACSYVTTWRAHGRQHTETHRTMEEAREAKRGHEADVARGEFVAASRLTLHTYAREWVERYQGTGRRGFRDQTRDEYRALLERFALRYFPPGLRVAEVEPRMVADFIGWLTRQPTRQGGTLADASVRGAFKPLGACLMTAREEGVIRHNPAEKARLPHRPGVEEDDERARPFPPGTMELVIDLVHPRHRVMFELLAATGVRRSELLALQGRHLALDGDRPRVKVRQRVRRQRGQGLIVGALKSHHARRDLPIPLPLADRLRALSRGSDQLVFASEVGTLLDPNNVNNRILAPAAEEAGVAWARLHTFRHTVASRLFAEGRNAVQVQHWLGHHAASFTLDTYVHLLDDDIGAPLLPRVNTGSTGQPGMVSAC